MARKFTRRNILKCSAVASAVGLAGCTASNGSGDTSTPSSTEESVTMGILLPFTGDIGAYGDYERRGVEAAIDMVNQSGGIHDGRQVEATVQPSKNSPQGSRQGLTTLLQSDITLLYGPTSNTMQAVGDMIKDEGLYSSLAGGTTWLDDKGGGVDGLHTYRPIGSDTDIGRARASYALEKGWEKVVLANIDSTGAASVINITERALDAAGIDIVGKETLAATVDSYRSEISSISNTDADVLVMNIGPNKAPLFIREKNQVGLDMPVMMGNEVVGSDSVVEETSAEAMDGIIGIRPGEGDGYEIFREKYESLHDRSPDPFSYAAFDGAMIGLLSLEAADEVSREAVTSDVREISQGDGEEVTDFSDAKEILANGGNINYQGATSNCNFDEFGDAVPPQYVFEFQDGEWAQDMTYTQEGMAVSKEELSN